MVYFLIFISKTVENVLATLRIILISNQKKLMGATLNFIVTLIWIFSTISILRNFTKEPLCILVYAFGCFIGSYLGSSLEEKLALGESMLTVITKHDSSIELKLRELGYIVTIIDGYGYNSNKKVLLIMIPRKKKYKVFHLIKLLDNKATIISENASYVTN